MSIQLTFTQEVKDRWTAALRSGEYKQCHQMLSDKTNAGLPRYCCLGVLQALNDLTVIGFGTLAAKEPDDYARTTIVEGLSLEDQSLLAMMNDDEHKSFTQISDHIDGNISAV